MKKSLLFICILFCSISTYSQIKFDTLFTKTVGSGITHSMITAPSLPWVIHVLKVDLKNPNNKVESVKADDQIAGLETLSSMVKRNSAAGHYVVGAVNSDFFDMSVGRPCNIQVRGGQILQNPSNNLSTVGFDSYGHMSMGYVNYSGSIIKDGKSYAINGTNMDRAGDQMVLYNRLMGPSTLTNEYGTELVVAPLGQWLVNDTIRCVIKNKIQGKGNTPITDGLAVLSGNGAAATFLNDNLAVNDTIKIVNSLSGSPKGLKEMVGGYPRIVKDGKNWVKQGVAAEGGPDHAYQIHPRTAVGFSKDSTQLYLVIVDGRSSASLGMTLDEMADFMTGIGVYQGMNFDGGGSTEMIVRDSVVNTPSDGAERELANGLIVVSEAPAGNLKNLIISPKDLRLFLGKSQKLSVIGTDEYYNPYALNSSGLKYSLSKSSLGTISNGIFKAGLAPDTGYLYVSYGAVRDSIPVIVKSISKLSLSPENVLTDTTRQVRFKVSAYDVDNIQYKLSATLYKYKTADQFVATIDSTGLLRGRHEGTTQVICSYNGITDTALVTVKLLKGQKSLESFEGESYKCWYENMDTLSTRIEPDSQYATEGTKSLKLSYRFTYNQNKYNIIHIPMDIPIEGVPDSVSADFRGDGQTHSIVYKITDDNGEFYSMSAGRASGNSSSFERMGASVSDASAVISGTVFNFPIRLKELSLKLSCSQTESSSYSGTVYIDNLRVSYPDKVTAVYDKNSFAVKDYTLMQNYPNPFNPSTEICFSLPKAGLVTLRVYNILGQEVACLLNETRAAGTHSMRFNAADLASGTYLYRITAGGFSQARKMILLK